MNVQKLHTYQYLKRIKIAPIAAILISAALFFSSYTNSFTFEPPEKYTSASKTLIPTPTKIIPVIGTPIVKAPTISISKESYSAEGFLIVTLDREDPDSSIYLPDVSVWALDASTSKTVATTRTDLSGRFRLFNLTAGEYVICWQADGLFSGCVGPEFGIKNSSVQLGQVYARFNSATHKKNNMGALYGKVLFKDNTSHRSLEPYANVNAFASMSVLNEYGGVISKRVYVNNFGYYFIPSISMHYASHKLRGDIENLKTDISIPLGVMQAGAVKKMNLTLNNERPKVQSIEIVTEDGKNFSVAPGDTVIAKAVATDNESDIKIRWVVASGHGTISGFWGEEIEWTLPKTHGTFSITAVAYDDEGGYSKESMRVTTGLGVQYSGYVVDNSGNRVEKADVSVNGEQTTTDDQGFFHLNIEEAERYVLNIRKFGYGIGADVTVRAVTGGQWLLPLAQVFTVDPTQDIDIQHKRTREDCLGPRGAKINWDRYEDQIIPKYHDGKGNILSSKELPDKAILPYQYYAKGELNDRECGPGIRVRIPANSLVDENGKLPSGTLAISLSTIDPFTPGMMPGDNTAIDSNGNTAFMESFGAGFIKVTDGSQAFNLIPGTFAEMTFPIDPILLAAPTPPPQTIPMLYYNEATGNWDQEGMAAINANKTAYVAKLPHFSEINMDLLKTNQSCIRVDSIIMPSTYDLEISVERDNGTIATKLETIDQTDTRFHVLYNLPNNRDVTLVAFETGTVNVIDSAIVNSGSPQFPSNPNRPEFPYAACNAFVELLNPNIPGAPINSFLNGVFGTPMAQNLSELAAGNANDQQLRTNIIQASTDYYASIDPHDRRLTLGDFKTENNFNGVGEIDAIYANTGDLGFGRQMHCKRTEPGDISGFDVACYVTNFGDRFTDDQTDFVQNGLNYVLNELGVANADVIAPPGATVAMEYSRLDDPQNNSAYFNNNRTVKFYVYPPGDDAQPRITEIDLDGNGERPIPQLCVICHGGSLPAETGGVYDFNINSVDMGSHFLPFDLAQFTIEDNIANFGGFSFDKADQQPAFKQLNENIVAVTEPGGVTETAIEEVITKMYLGGPVQDESFVVDGWAGEPAFYREVVGPSCRGCHISREGLGATWNTEAEFSNNGGFIDSLVCQQQVMPHAIVTYKQFWLSVNPHQPDELNNFIGSSCSH